MKPVLKLARCVLVIGVAFLSSCKKEPPSPLGNHRPVANAGPDQTIILPASSVVLDGSGSTDPDNDIVNYLWTNILGPSTPKLAAGNTAKKEVTNLKRGNYEFELLVTDAGGLRSKDTVRVTVLPDTVSSDSIAVISGTATITRFGSLSEAKSVIPATAADKLVFAGGYLTDQTGNWVSTASVDIYNLTSNTWSTTQLSENRGGITVATVGNKILYAGGFNNTSFSSRVDIYDAATDSWSTAQLSLARSNMTTTVAGNKVFFAGWEYSGFTTRVDIYDASSNSWSTAELSEARTRMSVVAAGNKVFFAGGYRKYDGLYETGYDFSTRVDIYDITTNTWSTAELKEARSRIAAAVAGNKVFFAGGYYVTDPVSGQGSTSKWMDVYDASTNIWSATSLDEPHSGMVAATAGNKVLFAEPGASKVYIYDAGANGWSQAVLNSGNISSTTTLGNKILFFTGDADFNHINIYDASANNWSQVELSKSLYSLAIAANNQLFIGGGEVHTIGTYDDVHLTRGVWKLQF